MNLLSIAKSVGIGGVKSPLFLARAASGRLTGKSSVLLGGKLAGGRVAGLLSPGTITTAGLGFTGGYLADRIADSPYGQEMRGVARLGVRGIGLASKVIGAKGVIKGAMGTGFHGAGMMMGDPAKYMGAYTKASDILGRGVLGFRRQRDTTGGGWAFGSRADRTTTTLGGGVMRAALRQTGRFAVGPAYALGSAIRVGANMTGHMAGTLAGGTMMAAGAVSKGLTGYGSGLMRAGVRVSSGMSTSMSIGRQLSPRLIPPFMAGRGRMRGLTRGFNEGPVMSGMLMLGMAGGLGHAALTHDNKNKNWRFSMGGGVNPDNYGMGIHRMRRGPARNYGPSLTLRLHHNHNRVMSPGL